MARTLGALVAALLVLFSPPLHAQAPTPEPLYAPSIFSYGFDGFALGAGAGLAAGYLGARSGGWHQDDWQPVAYGVGIGALAGGALGLTLGITDMANETQGRGYFILRDGGYGLGFGIATGAIIGGLSAIGSKKPEHILVGGAIGGLVGTGAGVVLGIVEGQRAWRRHTRVAFTMSPVPEAGGSLAWLPTLVGRY